MQVILFIESIFISFTYPEAHQSCIIFIVSSLHLLLGGTAELAAFVLDYFHRSIVVVAKDSVGDIRMEAISIIKAAAKHHLAASKRYLSEFMPSLIAIVQDPPNIKVLIHAISI